MAVIKDILPREILDSRGNPTIETTVILENGVVGTAAVPSGASVGTYEAVELRDRDESRYHGLGVQKAIANIRNIIAPKVLGMEATKQADIDRLMIDLDGTQNKASLGANAILSVSMAVCKAAARSQVTPLFLYLHKFTGNGHILKIPTPLFNVINGGKHAGGNIDFQEYIIFSSISTPYQKSLEMAVKVYKSLKDVLKQNNLSTLVGDEGGFGPNLPNNHEAFALIKQAVTSANLRVGFDIFFGLDVAANSFYTNKLYHTKEKPAGFNTNELITVYEDLKKNYNLLYLEDALFEDDWEGWTALEAKMGGSTIIVGDDLVVSNPYRLQKAITKRAVSGIIVKPNQIGTVIEALAVVEIARAAGLKIIVSHRSGETNDDFVADFAVAVGADYCKFGAPVRGERIAKYNRLLQIEQQLLINK